MHQSNRIVSTVSALTLGASPRESGLMLRIESSRQLPGLRKKSTLVPSDSVTTSGRLFQLNSKISSGKSAAIRSEEAKARAFDGSRIWTLPLRQASYWTWRGFKGVQKIFTDDDFIFIKVDGRGGAWKLDRNPTWALGEGKAFDSLVRHNLVHA